MAGLTILKLVQGAAPGLPGIVQLIIAIVGAIVILMLWLGFGRLRQDIEHPFGLKRIHIPPPAQPALQEATA